MQDNIEKFKKKTKENCRITIRVTISNTQEYKRTQLNDHLGFANWQGIR